MKKSYLLIAAAGLIMAACSQEDDFVAQNQAAAGQNDGAVMFDTYLSNNGTRAGKSESMTTKTLQESGFGIFAATHPLNTKSSVWPFDGYAASYMPNFMWNQAVKYEASNWVYSPLKYWPNETTNDEGTGNSPAAYSTNVEGVSFFAYAPYVQAKIDGTVTSPLIKESSSEVGITALTGNDEDEDPKVSYTMASTPSNSVDLLWGTSAGFTYHPVQTNAATVEPAGYPVLNMMKPALDEKIKFDFKHALARIGMTIVGAFDQVAAGGEKDVATRITVKSISVSSEAGTPTGFAKPFAKSGILNLNNGTNKDRAIWTDFGYSTTDPANKTTFSIDNTATSEMNPNLKYGYHGLTANAFPYVHGVTSTEQNVIVLKGDNAWADVTVAANTKYNENDGYFNSSMIPVEEAASSCLKYDATGSPAHWLISDGIIYEYASSAPTVDVTKKVYKLSAAPANLTSSANEDKPAVDPNKVYLMKLETNKYQTVDYADIPAKVVAVGDYVSIAKTEYIADPLEIQYVGGTLKSVKKNAGYFMVIPTTTVADPEDVYVTVTIDYTVTTKDARLNGGTSEIENVISQVVKLEKFTNGMSYNLKLILGLTSVKVDAEVSNWEVGTVESNLPQNLE